MTPTRNFMQTALACGLLIGLASPVQAQFPSGTWGGSYICNGVAAGMTIEITPQSNSYGTAVMHFFPITPGHDLPEGSYSMDVLMREDSQLVTLQPRDWIDQPDPRFIMIGFYGPRRGDSISGEVFNAEGCTTFTLEAGLSPAALADTPQTEDDWEIGLDEVLPGEEPADDGDTAFPNGEEDVLAADVPGNKGFSAQPMTGQNDFFGIWALNEMGMTIWSTSIERDFSLMLETRTHTATTAAWMRNSGALEIREDGTYRIYWLSRRWQGNWVPHAETGGLLLIDDKNRANDWVVFRWPGTDKMRAGRVGHLLETAVAEMTPIGNPAVAQYMLTPTDVATLAGTWRLWDGMDMGTITVSPDGRYTYDGYYGPIAGNWQVDGETLKLPDFDGRKVILYADESVPGQIVISGGGVQMIGNR